MKIKAIFVANLFEYASYKGISEELLRNYLLEKKMDVCNDLNSITEIEYLKLFEGFQKMTKDMLFGIHFGFFLNIKALGFIVQLSLNSTSIKQAVFILQNY